MAKIFLSVPILDEIDKKTDQINEKATKYMKDISDVLLSHWHEVRYSLQNVWNPIADLIPEPWFWSTRWWWRMTWVLLNQVIEEFRKWEKLYMVCIWKAWSDQKLINSYGMKYEFETYAKDTTTDIITIYPEKEKKKMEDQIKTSIESIPYVWDINSEKNIKCITNALLDILP